MTSFVTEVEEAFFEGRSVNLTGLSGSGRTKAIHDVEASLADSPEFWSYLLWNRANLVSLSRDEQATAITVLQAKGGVPVLLIDDYGDHLLSSDGRWLEQHLFAAVNRQPADDEEFLRCLVVTSPRDIEIQIPGSGLRERATTMYAPRLYVSREVEQCFGFAEGSEVLGFCGGTHLLAAKTDVGDMSARGIARQRASERAYKWVGEMTPSAQSRLGIRIDRRQFASLWRDGTDDSIQPLVTPSYDGRQLNCNVIEVVDGGAYLPLLLDRQWPNRAPGLSARRFAGRVGNDRQPLWIDNFLSDTAKLGGALLVQFLEALLRLWPDGRCLNLLSRSFVDAPVAPATIEAHLRSSGLSESSRARIVWKLYDSRANGNLHDRQLILRERGTAFGLPPATVVVGQVEPGNDSDSEVPFRNHQAVLRAWSSGTIVG